MIDTETLKVNTIARIEDPDIAFLLVSFTDGKDLVLREDQFIAIWNRRSTEGFGDLIPETAEEMKKLVEKRWFDNVEDHFITNSAIGPNVETFNLVEGEDGGTYWGYGWVDPKEFIAEVNRWLKHCDPSMDDEDLVSPDESGKIHGVKHLWARYEGAQGDFVTAEPTMTEADADLFPVTRFWN